MKISPGIINHGVSRTKTDHPLALVLRAARATTALPLADATPLPTVLGMRNIGACLLFDQQFALALLVIRKEDEEPEDIWYDYKSDLRTSDEDSSKWNNFPVPGSMR